MRSIPSPAEDTPIDDATYQALLDTWDARARIVLTPAEWEIWQEYSKRTAELAARGIGVKASTKALSTPEIERIYKKMEKDPETKKLMKQIDQVLELRKRAKTAGLG